MAPYTYNNFYDPVGSQSNQQPSGYTYQSNSTSSNAQYPSQNTSYQTNYSSKYGISYGAQQYASSSQQQQPPSQSQQAASTNAATSALQDYSQPAATTGRSGNVASGYDNPGWTAQNYASSAYNTMTSRSQANQSPLYATQGSSATFGRLSLPDQSQTSSNSQPSYQAPAPAPTSTSTSSSSRTYMNAPNSAGYKNTHQPQHAQQQQPPQRYASPLHAMQAQQHQSSHNKQPSRSSNQAGPSPQMSGRNLQQQRQQSASVEPSPATVDPSQVYDFRAEQEKRARIEAEKRRKIEAERAAKQAEEDARNAEEDARKAEEERIAAEARKAEEDARKNREADAKKEVAKQRRAEQRKKAREEKYQSNTAATALQQMASSSAAPAMSGADMMTAMMGNMSGPPANNEEAEMRAMFKKMREFNQKNPTMLAKLWEEELQQHAAQSSQQPDQPVRAAAPAPVEAAAAAAAPGPANASAKQQQKQKKKATAPAAIKPPAQPSMQPSAPSSSRTPAQTSPTKAPGGSLWPPHKKGSLAEAAAKWLGALPENTGKSVSRQGILGILDNNPSYVQLCEAIEKTGIKFERSALAKELLKAVPDGLKTPAGPKPPTPAVAVTAQLNGAATASTPGSAPPKKRGRPKKDEPGRYSLPGSSSRGSGTVSYATPSFSSLADAAREVNSMNNAPYYPPAISGSLSSALADGNQQNNFTDYEAPMVIDDNALTSNIKPEDKPESPPPREPADKEEAARKRGFGDLVDLTAADSDDEDGPPPKFFKAMPPPVTNGVLGSNDFRKPMPYNQFMHQRQSLIQGEGSMHPSDPPRPAFNPQQLGQWPPQKPRSPMPTGSASSQVKPKGPTEEQKQQERMRGKMLVEPIMRDRVARKSRYNSRTIARDVLLATGRHPDMRALNGHMNVMQRLLGDHGGVVDGAGNKSDLKTIRWDIIDPGEPTDEAKARAKSVSRDKSDDVEESDVESSRPVSRRREDTEVDSDTPNYKSVSELSGVKKAKARRGPGRTLGEHVASDSTSNKLEHPELTSDLTHRASPGRPRKYTVFNTARESASSDMAPTGAVGYSAFRQYDESGNPVKKKGRPVGWRKSIHSREAQGLTPVKSKSSAVSHVTKGPGGTRLRQSATNDGLVQPRYQIFRCEWKGCGGELDNLERLRKHVIKIHGSPNSDGDYECLWKRCQSNGLHIDDKGKASSGKPGVSSFERIEDWTKHINKAHVEEVAWKLGDGPKGGSVSEQYTDSEAYLSDAQGRSVTPIIVPRSEQQVTMEESKGSPSAATIVVPPVKRGPGRPPRHQEVLALGATNLTKELREAHAELKKLDDQKQVEGFTMGLQGSRLVNEKRRRGFLDDEDFEDVIHDIEPVFVPIE